MSTLKPKWSNYLLFSGSNKFLIGIIVCLIISSVLGAFIPSLIAKLSRVYSDAELFYQTLWSLSFLFVGIYLNRIIYQLTISNYVYQLMQYVRELCFKKWIYSYDIQTDKENRHEQFPQGEVLARIMNDTEALRELMTSGTFGVIIDIFFVLSCLFSFLMLNLTSGIVLVISEITASIALVWGSRYMRDIFLSVRKARGDMSRTVANVVGGLSQTYYTPHYNYASKKGENVFENFLSKQLKSNVWDASYYSIAESLYPLLLALVVFILPYSKITDAAIIFAIVDLIQRSINPVKDISSKIANVQRAYSGMIRINDFLYELSLGWSSENKKFDNDFQFVKLKVNINHFSYPLRDGESEVNNAFSLKNVSFEASKGELIGIVGLSGCGKSTVLNIISANIIPKNALIELVSDSKNINFPGNGLENVLEYREQVGIVSQDSHVFSESIEFNITLTEKKSKDFSDFWKSVQSQIPYIQKWGLEPETIIDQKALSLGQKQLLAAIRSCYLKKPIVLFDEISSGLDGELELALRKMVLLVQKHSLTFIVAHRIETLLESDKLIVMDKGEIIDSGRHNDLSDRCQIYREFLKELSQ